MWILNLLANMFRLQLVRGGSRVLSLSVLAALISKSSTAIRASVVSERSVLSEHSLFTAVLVGLTMSFCPTLFNQSLGVGAVFLVTLITAGGISGEFHRSGDIYFEMIIVLIFALTAYLINRTARYNWARYEQTTVENQTLQRFLSEMLPAKVLDEFSSDELRLAYVHVGVTFLFADICNFTAWAKTVRAQVVVETLNVLFGLFDADTSIYGVYKVCTIGDAYVAISQPAISDSGEGLRNDTMPMRASKTTASQGYLRSNTATSPFNSHNHKSQRKSFFSDSDSDQELEDDARAFFKLQAGSTGVYAPSILRGTSIPDPPVTSGEHPENDDPSNGILNNIISQLSDDEYAYSLNGARSVMNQAHAMLQHIQEARQRLGISTIDMRVGMHYGSCVGGVIGSGRLR